MATEKLNLPEYVTKKYDVHALMPKKFIHKGVRYEAELLTNQQADALAADKSFEFINKKEKEEKPSGK